MEKDQFLALLSKRLTKEISAEEDITLTNAIASNEEFGQIAEKLIRYFNRRDVGNTAADKLKGIWAMIEKAEYEGFKPVSNESVYQKHRFNTNALLKIAVVLILGVSVIGLSQFYKQSESTGSGHYAATYQKAFKLLEDGTKVWLNKNSSMHYNTEFGRSKREITLQGEAYFDVAENAAVPLFIHVGELDIEVKGTAFNVNANRENPSVEVALARGLIEVRNRMNNDKILLKPNEKLVIPHHLTDGHPGQFTVVPLEPLSLLKEIKWTSDTLVFRKEKLKDLIVQMEKKYELKMEIHSAKLGEKRFSGVFTNETIQQALEALKLSYPLTYVISNKLVVISD